MDRAMTDDMLAILEEEGLRQAVTDSLMKRMDFHLTHQKTVGTMRVGAVAFSNVYGVLGKTEAADEILGQIRKES